MVRFYDNESSWSYRKFARGPGCDQSIVGPAQARCKALHLLIIDIPVLVRVAVVGPLGNSDHSSLLAVISMAQAAPNLRIIMKVFIRQQINWNTICVSIQVLP